MDNRTILGNLINYYANGNKKRFSEMLGIKPQTLSVWLNRCSMDYVLLFTKLEGVSASFLLTGDGDMLADQTSPSISQTVSNSANGFSIMDKTTMLECLINYFTDGNKAAFARMLGIKPQTINSWLLRNSFDIDLIYSKCAGISASWLLTGEGEMFEAPSTTTISQTVTASSNVTQTAGAPAETPAAINALLAAKDETIAALRQSLADKERLICNLIEARKQ